MVAVIVEEKYKKLSNLCLIIRGFLITQLKHTRTYIILIGTEVESLLSPFLCLLGKTHMVFLVVGPLRLCP